MRCDDSYSALYAAFEDKFISIAEGKGQGDLTETIYETEVIHCKIFLIAGKPFYKGQPAAKFLLFKKMFNDYLIKVNKFGNGI